MRELVSWAVVAFFYTSGLGVLKTPNPKRIIASRVFFVLGGIIATGLSIMSGVSVSDTFWVRFIVSFCVVGLFGAATVELIRFAGHTEKIEANESRRPKPAENASPVQPSSSVLPAPTPVTAASPRFGPVASSPSAPKTRRKQSKADELRRRKEEALRDLDYKNPKR